MKSLIPLLPAFIPFAVLVMLELLAVLIVGIGATQDVRQSKVERRPGLMLASVAFTAFIVLAIGFSIVLSALHIHAGQNPPTVGEVMPQIIGWLAADAILLFGLTSKWYLPKVDKKGGFSMPPWPQP